MISPHLRQRIFGSFRSEPQIAQRWLSSGILVLQEWQMTYPLVSSVLISGALAMGCCLGCVFFMASTGDLLSGLCVS
jgi:hypothetical protein